MTFEKDTELFEIIADWLANSNYGPASCYFLMAFFAAWFLVFLFVGIVFVIDEIRYNIDLRRYNRYIHQLNEGEKPYIPFDQIDMSMFVHRLKRKEKEKK